MATQTYKLHRLYFALFAFILFFATLEALFVGWPSFSTWFVDFSLAALLFYMGFSAKKDPPMVRVFGLVLQIILFLCFFYKSYRWMDGTLFERDEFENSNWLNRRDATDLWRLIYFVKTGLLTLSIVVDFIFLGDDEA